jgi:putative transcriptional regulator
MPIVRRSLAQACAEARVDPERLHLTSDADLARQAAEDPDTAPVQDDLASALSRGEAWVARPADPRAVRERLGISQAAFARMFGVSVWALRNWEQGRRRLEGPARALLRVLQREPEAADAGRVMRHDGLLESELTTVSPRFARTA